MDREIEMSDAELGEMFAEVGKEFGYDDVRASFKEFNAMKIRWQRGYKWINISISDLLNEAPDEVLRSTARMLFKRLTGGEGVDAYSKELIEYVTDPAFAPPRQNIIKKRCKYDGFPVHISCQVLDDLEKMGLIDKEMFNEYMFCQMGDFSNPRRAMGTSILLKMVILNPRILKECRLNTLTYVVYCALCTSLVGYKPNMGQGEYECLVDDMRHKYPADLRKEAREELRDLGLVLYD